MMQSGFRELLDEFVLEAHERVAEVEALLLELAAGDGEERREAIAKAKRELHTLKGNSGMMGFVDLQHQAHQMEDEVEALRIDDDPRIDPLLARLDRFRRQLESLRDDGAPEQPPGEAEPGAEPDTATPAAAAAPQSAPEAAAEDHKPPDAGPPELVLSSVRLPFSRIDRLVELQAESLIYRNRLSEAVERSKTLAAEAAGQVEGLAAAWEEIEEAQQAVEKILKLLQHQVTELGMVPLRGLFRSLRRVVHDESQREDKRVELTVEGGDTPIDKALLEAAGEALGHLVRNAVIHGIETPDERRRRGKSEIGHLRLAATIAANEVRIEVTDDGGGIDLAALSARAAALAEERDPAGRRAQDLAAGYALLFEDGVSTRHDADLGAGRGVGLSTVKKSVERHGGRVDVESQAGVGTCFSLRLPISASILRSLILGVDGEEYALPLTAVTETLRPDPQDRHEVHRAGVLRWRNRVVPLLDLGCAFGTAETPRSGGFVIVMEVSGRFRGLAIDEIVGIRDIVVKGLDRIVGDTPGVSGSTILGDGRVIMILDPTALTTMSPSTTASDEPEEKS